MNYRLLFLLVALSILRPASASAELVPPFKLKEFVDRADLVLLGTISGVTDQGPTTVPGFVGGSGARIIRGRIDVRQVLKGSVTSERVPFQSPVWSTELHRIVGNPYGVVLLKGLGFRREFVSPHYPLLQTVVVEPIYKRDAFEAVIEALTAVFRVPDAPVSARRWISWHFSLEPTPLAVPGLRAALRDPDRDTRLHAAKALRTLGVDVDTTGPP